MRFIDWLRTFPLPSGRPAGSVLPGMIVLILIEAFLVGLFAGLTIILARLLGAG